MKTHYAVSNPIKNTTEIVETEQEAIDLSFKYLYEFFKSYNHGVFYTKVLIDDNGNQTWQSDNQETNLPKDILEKLKANVYGTL